MGSVTRVLAALVAVLMVTLAAVAVIALRVSGAAFDSSPGGVASSVAQDPVPPIKRTPQVRIAVAGDTGVSFGAVASMSTMPRTSSGYCTA